MRMSPSFTELLDWVEGRLTEQESRRVEALVEADPQAADAVVWIREFRRAAAVLPLQRPPAPVSAGLRALFRDHHVTRNRDWVEATLRFDSRRQPLVGVRATSTTQLAHLVYDGDFGALVLDVQRPACGEVGLRGYLSLHGGPEHGARVSVHAAGAAQRISRCDHNGRFELHDVPAGADELWIAQGAERVRVPLDLHA